MLFDLAYLAYYFLYVLKVEKERVREREAKERTSEAAWLDSDEGRAGGHAEARTHGAQCSAALKPSAV